MVGQGRRHQEPDGSRTRHPRTRARTGRRTRTSWHLAPTSHATLARPEDAHGRLEGTLRQR